MPQTKIQSPQISDTGVTPGSYTSANVTVDAAGRITAVSNGAGGASFFTASSDPGPATFIFNNNFDDTQSVDDTFFKLRTEGPISITPTVLSITNNALFQLWEMELMNATSVSAGFTFNVTVSRQAGSTGLSFVISCVIGGIDLTFLYDSNHPTPSLRDRFSIRDNAVEIAFVTGSNLWTTPTTSRNIAFTVLGTALTVTIDGNPYTSATIFDRSSPTSTVSRITLYGSAISADPPVPGFVGPRFTNLLITGNPVAPVTTQVNTSPTNSQVSFSNLIINPSGALTVVEQQSILFSNTDSADINAITTEVSLYPSKLGSQHELAFAPGLLAISSNPNASTVTIIPVSPSYTDNISAGGDGSVGIVPADAGYRIRVTPPGTTVDVRVGTNDDPDWNQGSWVEVINLLPGAANIVQFNGSILNFISDGGSTLGYGDVAKITLINKLTNTWDIVITRAGVPPLVMYDPELPVTAGLFVVNSWYIVLTLGTTDFTLVGGQNVVGSIFKATGIGIGTGTAALLWRYTRDDSVQRKVIFGTGLTATVSGANDRDITITGTGGGSALIVSDEGSVLTLAASSLNFVGTGVTATNVGNAVTVTVPGSVGVNREVQLTDGAGQFIAADSYFYTLNSQKEQIGLLFGEEGADLSVNVTAPQLIRGFKYQIVTIGTTDFTLVGAAANTVGQQFVAFGPGTGTGTATPQPFGSQLTSVPVNVSGTNKSGSNLSIRAQSAFVTGIETANGGSLFLEAGNGGNPFNTTNRFGTGGNLTIKAGNSVEFSGGNLFISAGDTNSPVDINGSVGGDVDIRAGSTSIGSLGEGGNVIINAGYGPNGDGSIFLNSTDPTGLGNGSVRIAVGKTGATGAHFSVSTNDLERLRIGSNGAWNLNQLGGGSAGAVITSDGSGRPPQWRPGAAALNATTAAINTTQTLVGSTSASWLFLGPTLFGMNFPAKVIRYTVYGTCTSTAASTSSIRLHFDPDPTLLTGNFYTATVTSATTGTNVPFKVVFEVSVRSTTASATAPFVVTGELFNNGTTGISTTAIQLFAPTTGTIDTTSSSYFAISYQSSTVNTTCTFQNMTIEVIR
jgi:hypothetical protein